MDGGWTRPREGRRQPIPPISFRPVVSVRNVERVIAVGRGYGSVQAANRAVAEVYRAGPMLAAGGGNEVRYAVHILVGREGVTEKPLYPKGL